jgi:hypothetical protein
MNPRVIHLPIWKFSEVNKRGNGTIAPDLEVVTSNMVANAEAAETNVRKTDSVIYICVREKLADGDHLCGIGTIPFDKNDNDVVEIILEDQFQKMPHIVITPSKGIADVVRRVLKNIIFS